MKRCNLLKHKLVVGFLGSVWMGASTMASNAVGDQITITVTCNGLDGRPLTTPTFDSVSIDVLKKIGENEDKLCTFGGGFLGTPFLDENFIYLSDGNNQVLIGKIALDQLCQPIDNADQGTLAEVMLTERIPVEIDPNLKIEAYRYTTFSAYSYANFPWNILNGSTEVKTHCELRNGAGKIISN